MVALFTNAFNPGNVKGPFTIVIGVTNDCNVRCPGCLAFDDHSLPLGLMEYDLMFRIFQAYGVNRLSFAGGEPMTRSDIFDVVQLAKQYDFITALCTNGTLVTEETIRRFDGILDEIIIPLHSVDTRIARLLTPYAKPEHIKRMQSLFSFINIRSSIQIKPQTILAKVNYDHDILTRLGRVHLDIGVQTWKIDQYYHVDKPQKIKDRFYVDNRDYNFMMDLLRRFFDTRLKIIGIGGTFRFGENGFLISPSGMAFRNVEGSESDKIIGDILTDYRRLFECFNGPQMPETDYALVKAAVPAICQHAEGFSPYQEQTRKWFGDLIDVADIGVEQKVLCVDFGMASEIIAEFVIWGMDVDYVDKKANQTLDALVQADIQKRLRLNYHERGHRNIIEDDFSTTDVLSGHYDVVLIKFDDNESLARTISKCIKAVAAVREQGKVLIMADAKPYPLVYSWMTDLLKAAGVTYTDNIQSSISRPFTQKFGFASVIEIQEKGLLTEPEVYAQPLAERMITGF